MTQLVLLKDWISWIPEIWRPVVGFPGYEVSNRGRVRTYWERIATSYEWSYTLSSQAVGYLRGGLDKDGYVRVTLSKQGRIYRRGVHQLALRAFEGDHPQRNIPNHLNNVKDDNRLDNLKWSTVAENTLHANEIGAGQRGESHHRARLTGVDVLRIRATVHSRSDKLKAAQEYKCTVENIQRIVTRMSWRYI